MKRPQKQTRRKIFRKQDIPLYIMAFPTVIWLICFCWLALFTNRMLRSPQMVICLSEKTSLTSPSAKRLLRFAGYQVKG